MPLLRPRKIRPSSPAARTQSVAKRAIRPELRLAHLRRFRIAGKWILLLRAHCHRRCGTRNHYGAPKEKT
jgi:hypothetical protein